MGYLGFHCPVPGGHIQQKCVYPKGSTNSFLYSGGMFNVVGIRNGQKLCSTSDAWSADSPYCAYEFFPSEEPWDTIYTAKRNEVISTPYFENYTGLADQNFIFRLNDYSYEIPDQVSPLGIDVIVLSHAWSSHPFDDFILFEYFAIPKYEIEDAYFFSSGLYFTEPHLRNAVDKIKHKVKYYRYGGDCYMYGMVASGLIDFVIEDTLKVHDYMAVSYTHLTLPTKA